MVNNRDFRVLPPARRAVRNYIPAKGDDRSVSNGWAYGRNEWSSPPLRIQPSKLVPQWLLYLNNTTRTKLQHGHLGHSGADSSKH